MRSVLAAVAVAALVTAGSAGCSDPPPARPKHGVLPAGTARLTIDGKDAGDTGVVECAHVGTQTTIRTGDDKTGVAVGLSTAAKLTVDFVRIRNMNGFSGDYNLGLGGDAAASVTDSTYHIAGSAHGYSPGSLAPAAQQFAIAVTC